MNKISRRDQDTVFVGSSFSDPVFCQYLAEVLAASLVRAQYISYEHDEVEFIGCGDGVGEEPISHGRGVCARKTVHDYIYIYPSLTDPH